MRLSPYPPAMSTPSSRKRQSCPVCGKAKSERDAPFCSQGCRDRDLLNWLGDSYRVPGPPAENGEDRLDSEG